MKMTKKQIKKLSGYVCFDGGLFVSAFFNQRESFRFINSGLEEKLSAVSCVILFAR